MRGIRHKLSSDLLQFSELSHVLEHHQCSADMVVSGNGVKIDRYILAGRVEFNFRLVTVHSGQNLIHPFFEIGTANQLDNLAPLNHPVEVKHSTASWIYEFDVPLLIRHQHAVLHT